MLYSPKQEQPLSTEVEIKPSTADCVPPRKNVGRLHIHEILESVGYYFYLLRITSSFCWDQFAWLPLMLR